MKIKTAFIITLFGVLPSFFEARADIAPDPMSGGISIEVTDREQSEVALVHNTVKLQISPLLCKTRAFFRLKNAGEATAFEVGFPLNYQGEANDFQVWIDGQSQIFEDRAIEKQDSLGRLRTRHWKIFPMKFAVAQTLLVEVRYSNTPPKGYTRLFLQEGRYPLFTRWLHKGLDYSLADFGVKEGGNLRDWVSLKMVQYILISGGRWKGPIERCRVEANIEKVAPDALFEVEPPAHSVSSQRLIWEWKNVEPANNIKLNFMGHSPLETIALLEKIATRHPEDEALIETLRRMKKDFPDIQTIRERQKVFGPTP